MKKKITTACAGLLFLAGLAALLYPTVSNWVNARSQSRVAENYEKAVSAMSETDYSSYLKAAEEYNRQIAENAPLAKSVRIARENMEEYSGLLNVAGNEVMGMIRIPKIDVSMPVYHTTEDRVLQAGAGHYVGSSLPVGGEGTHCILSGHTGLPSAKMFTDLDQLKEGDCFYLEVLGKTLAYETDRIEVVLPEKLDSLDIVPGQDYVTLVTCTPYGVNSHRLLVRGHRIPYVPEEEQAQESPSSGKRLPKILIFAVLTFAAAIAAGTICGNISRRRKNKKRRREE